MTEDLAGTEFGISEIIVHPDWDILTQSYEADIAIAILEKLIKFSPNLTNICLNEPSRPVGDFFTGQNGTVSGWGHSQTSKYKHVDDLRAVTVPIVDHRYCKESRTLREIYADTLFCAGRTDTAAGPCKGKMKFVLFSI